MQALCYEEKVMDVGYFLDMPAFELPIHIGCMSTANKTSWEQARIQAYIGASIWSKRQLKPSDILKFPWDGSVPGNDRQTISDSDIDRLRRLSQQKFVEVTEQ